MRNSFFGRLHKYQKERFPLVLIVLTTCTVVLGSAGILRPYGVHPIRILAAFLVGVIYLFHIRVLDERKDHAHDTKHHPSRPIQRGLVTLQELTVIDWAGIIFSFFLSLYFGTMTFLFALLTFAYCALAGNDFFLGEKIRQRFFLYNSISIFQLVLLQMFIYSVLSTQWYEMRLIWPHLVFVLLNSILLEVLRKIRLPGEETAARDTYSSRMGFVGSLLFFSLLTVIHYGIFVFLFSQLSAHIFYTVISILCILCVWFSILFHSSHKTKTSEKKLLLSVFFLYLIFNSMLFLIR